MKPLWHAGSWYSRLRSLVWPRRVIKLPPPWQQARQVEEAHSPLLNWRLVRSLGELQILTRASYAMLIIVPLLAGTWPAVRLIVNQQDKALKEAAATFDRATMRFFETRDRIARMMPGSAVDAGSSGPVAPVEENRLSIADSLHAVANNFVREVNQYNHDHASRTIESLQMPRTFVAAFMTALSVVLAHSLYQMFAPETVRRMTLSQYILEKREDYARHRSFEAVSLAIDVLGEDSYSDLRGLKRGDIFDLIFELSDTKDDEQHRTALEELNPITQIQLREFCDQDMLSVVDIPKDAKIRIDQTLREIEKKRDPSVQEKLEHQRNMATIARAAKVEYLYWAQTNWTMSMLTALLYAFAIYLIFSIVVYQTLSVLNAAGMSAESIITWWRKAAE